MMRQAIQNITNELSENYSNQCRLYGDDYDCCFGFDLRKCYDLVLEYCKNNGTSATPRKNKYRQDNGFLYINEENVGRIGIPYDKPNWNALPKENEVDYEALILARQEGEWIYD